MHKILFFILLTLLSWGTVFAKKNPTIKTRLKEARLARKDDKGQKDAADKLLAMIDTGNVNSKDKAQAYYLVVLLQKDINDDENMKAYLKQKCDTGTLFSTVLKINKYSLLCDSFDVKGTYARRTTKLRSLHQNNLYHGGRYYMRKKKWDDAIRYFDAFVSIHQPQDDSLSVNSYFLASVCAVNLNKPYLVLKYIEKAIELAPEKDKAKLAEYQAKSILATSDSTQWIDFVEKNEKIYVGDRYFFLSLIDWYLHHGKYEQGLARTDELLKQDGEKAIYWYSKALLAMHKQDYELAVKMSQKCLDLEPENTDALYTLGISYCNLAVESNDKTKMKSYYQDALEPIEKLRKLCPDGIKQWGNPLYRIYLNLNMGRKFDEIDHLLKIKS